MTNQRSAQLLFSDFGFCISFGLRTSDFGLLEHVPQLHPLASATMARFVARAGTGWLRADSVPTATRQSVQAN